MGAAASAEAKRGAAKTAADAAPILRKSRRPRRWGKRYSEFMGGCFLAGKGIRRRNEKSRRGIHPAGSELLALHFNTAWWNSYQSSRLLRFTASLGEPS